MEKRKKKMAAATNAVNADDFPFVESEQQHWTTPAIQRVTKHNNILPIWKSAETMNLNHLILENIRISPYFKNKLSTLTKYQEVIDELFYQVCRFSCGLVLQATTHRFFQVSHLEPWERGTYKTAGQTGMCGGVSGKSKKNSSCFLRLFIFHWALLIIVFFIEGERRRSRRCSEYAVLYHVQALHTEAHSETTRSNDQSYGLALHSRPRLHVHSILPAAGNILGMV